jgi:hypothetical protein
MHAAVCLGVICIFAHLYGRSRDDRQWDLQGSSQDDGSNQMVVIKVVLLCQWAKNELD